MRKLAGSLLALGRRARLAVWSQRARARMRWVGIRFELEAGEGAVFVENPYVLAGMRDPGDGPGSLTVRVGRRVRLAPGVIFEAEPGVDSVLEIGDGTRIGPNVHFHLRGGSVRIGEYCEVRGGCVFKTTGGQIRIGSGCMLSFGCVLHATEEVLLGDRVGLGERVTLVDSGHDSDGSDVHWAAHPAPTAPVVIGENTALFANVVALMGTRLGRNSHVAAGALIRAGEYPDGVLLAGVPARVVRELSDG